jgi:D-xylonolactonase
MVQEPDYHVVSATQNTLGEGPIWDPRIGAFLWVDAYRQGFYSATVGVRDGTQAGDDRRIGNLPRTGPASCTGFGDTGLFGKPRFHHTGFFTIGITPRGTEAGRYLLAGADGLYDYTMHNGSPDTATGRAERIADAPFAIVSATAQTHRFNDVIAAPDGSYLAGMMPWSPGTGAYADGGGALLRYTRRDRVGVVLPTDDAPGAPTPRLPNGMGFSPDGKWFYWTDTLHKTIYRFPYDDGTIGAPEAYIVSTDHPGGPDGMTIATDGSILSARWGGGCIDHYNADGTPRARYTVPMRQPSSVAFGGPDLTILLVTSATEGMAPGAALPDDGITIAMDIGVAGRQEFSVTDRF